jgi:MFS family permease
LRARNREKRKRLSLKGFGLKMASVQLVMGLILAILAVVLIGVSTAISGIISTRLPAGDTKSRLLAISALSGFTAIFAVVAAVIGILFARAKSSGAKSYKALGITFLVLAILVLLMYATVIGLTLSVRAREELNPTNKNALTAGLIMIALGFVSLTVATILFFTITKGKSGKEAWQSLSLKKGSRSSAAGMGSSGGISSMPAQKPKGVGA